MRSAGWLGGWLAGWFLLFFSFFFPPWLVVVTLSTAVPSILDCVLLVVPPIQGGSLSEYALFLQNMAQDKTWGDELTLKAAADEFNVVIHIITSEKENWYLKVSLSVDQLGGCGCKGRVLRGGKWVACWMAVQSGTQLGAGARKARLHHVH